MEIASSADDIDTAVLAYLAEHPHAMDTLEGIAEFWIERQRIRFDVVRISRALMRLVDQGVLERIGAGESALYRLGRAASTASITEDSS